jgi:hypothetical protein
MAKSKRYKGRPKLTHTQVLELFDQGIYTADLEKGIVYSGVTGKPLRVGWCGRYEDKPYAFICLCYKNSRRFIPLSNVIWIVGSRREIPEGFEIHHRTNNPEDNWYDNLFCLFDKDHRKLHSSRDLLEVAGEQTPF